jgi:alkylation response protein AidB-like acyl-CoA dehydrogenase
MGVRVLGFTNARKLVRLASGNGTLGPESSIGKVFWSEWHQRLCELKLDVLGPEGLLYGYTDDEHDGMQRTFLLSRAETIYGGANQIQRNTLGERVLGLPKEPR